MTGAILEVEKWWAAVFAPMSYKRGGCVTQGKPILCSIMRFPSASIGLLASVVLPLAVTADNSPSSSAQGYGAETSGGHGGRVIAVTNLEDGGRGSLRAALAEKGPRTVVFRTGGVIRLSKDLFIDEPFVTIAGETCPADGPGISLVGAGLRVRTHDVIVRHLRIRVGDDPKGPRRENRDGIGIGDERSTVHHVVIDHCSVSWAVDENLQIWYPCHDITIQWCLIAESLENAGHPKGAHGMGLLVGDHAQRVSVHHNLFAHNMERSPLLKGSTETEVMHNLVYNWRHYATGLNDYERTGPIRADIIGNVYLPGPDTAGQFGVGLENNLASGSAVYLLGNTGPGRENGAGDEWAVAKSRGTFPGRSNERVLAPSGLPSKPVPAAELQAAILAGVGATLPGRDSIDERVLRSVKERSGKIINSPPASEMRALNGTAR
jgi:hypothetical protein